MIRNPTPLKLKPNKEIIMKKAIIATIIAINIISISNSINTALTEQTSQYGWHNKDTDQAFIVQGGEVVYSGSDKAYWAKMDKEMEMAEYL
jgi:hypothetical protein